MAMKDLLAQVLGSFGPELVSVVFTGLSVALAYAVKKFRDFVDEKIKNEQLNNTIDQVTEIAQSSVKAAGSSVRADIKKALRDGELTDDERREIKQRALVELKSQLSSEARANLDSVVGSAEKYLSNKVDQVLFDEE
jgi:maltooligosyltrehalose synthase